MDIELNPDVQSSWGHSEVGRSKFGNTVTVIGSAFATSSASQSGRVGYTTFEVTKWESESSVRCTVSGGVGSSSLLTMTTGVYQGSCTETYSYDEPLQNGIQGQYRLRNRPTRARYHLYCSEVDLARTCRLLRGNLVSQMQRTPIGLGFPVLSARALRKGEQV
jgi:hypothetical protein